MTFLGGLFKGLAAVVVSVLALGLFSAAAGPAASFRMAPDGNPVVGQSVQFTDTSTGGPTSWAWNFGDGQTATQQNSAHTYGGPGSFNVTLTASNGSGSTQVVQPLIVSPIDTLQLNNKGGHPFIVKLMATNQHNNNVQGPGQAIPQNDLFGYFSLPALTNNADNPEVFVKILGPVNGDYWVFYGHMTDLIYDLTVTEVATGLVKTFHKDAGNSAGGFDTSGFHPTSTPAPTPTPTPVTSGLTRVVNVGASGNFFTDSQSGGSGTTIHVGDTVKWVWIGNMHSTTSGTCVGGGGYAGGDYTCTPDGGWDSGLQAGGAIYSRKFTSVGTFRYYCQTHLGDMTGTVFVLP